MSRPTTVGLLAVAVAMVLLAGCTVGPSQRPSLATYRHGSDRGRRHGAVLGAGRTWWPGPARRPDPAGKPARTSTGSTGPPDCPSTSTAPPWWSTAALRILSAIPRSRSRGPGRTGSPRTPRPWWSSVAGRVRTVAVRSRRWRPACRRPSGSTSPSSPSTWSAPGSPGRSTACPGTTSGAFMTLGIDPTESASATALAELSRSLTFECGDLAGPELSTVNSTAAADDLDALRSALGSVDPDAHRAGVRRDPRRGLRRPVSGPARRCRARCAGRSAGRSRRQGGRNRRRRREIPGHLRRRLRRFRRRLPAGQRPARPDPEGGQHAGRRPGSRPGPRHDERRQRAADPATPTRRPRTAGRSWRRRWPLPPRATANRSRTCSPRSSAGQDAELARLRDHLRLQRQCAANIAGSDDHRGGERSSSRRRCSGPTPWAWWVSAPPGRRRRRRWARSRRPDRRADPGRRGGAGSAGALRGRPVAGRPTRVGDADQLAVRRSTAATRTAPASRMAVDAYLLTGELPAVGSLCPP